MFILWNKYLNEYGMLWRYKKSEEVWVLWCLTFLIYEENSVGVGVGEWGGVKKVPGLKLIASENTNTKWKH